MAEEDAEVSPMEAFMDSPLVVWAKTFNPGSKVEFNNLVEGTFLNEMMLQIDPRPTNQRINKQVQGQVHLRIQNLAILMRHIKSYYQDVLQQLIVMKLPDIIAIGKEPEGEQCIHELRKILLLVLGCAVQCEKKEVFIEKIKELDLDVQHAMVGHIQEITDNTDNIFCTQWSELTEIPPEELDGLSRNMFYHLKRLVNERDDYCEALAEITQERDYYQLAQQEASKQAQSPSAPGQPQDKNHLTVELADTKARLRRLRQELEEKSEQVVDFQHEIEQTNLTLQKLRQENLELSTDARSARAYRDELDVAKEKLSKTEKFESEIQRYKEKLNDLDFYKARTEELREDNRILHETKAMLEEQVESLRAKKEKWVEVEQENLRIKAQLKEMEERRDEDRRRIQELVDENMALDLDKRQTLNESLTLGRELEDAKTKSSSEWSYKGYYPLAAECNESATSRALRLEKENKRLAQEMEELREQMHHSDSSSTRMSELEKENQRLSEKLKRLQDSATKETQSLLDLEQFSDDLIKDKAQLEQTLETIKENSERQIKELERENEQLQQTINTLRQRTQELVNEKLHNQQLTNELEKLAAELDKIGLNKEKLLQQEHSQDESRWKALESRMESELKKSLEIKEEKVHALESRLNESVNRNQKLRDELRTLRREHEALQQKYEEEQGSSPPKVTVRRTTQGETTRELIKMKDQVIELERNNAKFETENSSLKQQSRSLESQCNKLQQQVSSLQSQNASLQGQNSNLQSQNAKLQVELSTLQSQKSSVSSENTKLQTQHSQSETQYRSLQKRYDEMRSEHTALQKDFERLQRLHSTLSTDNEAMATEHSMLKSNFKILKSDNKRLEDQYNSLLKENEGLKKMKSTFESVRSEDRTLAAVKADNERLQATNRKLTADYQDLQTDHKSLKQTYNSLQLEHTQLAGDLRDFQSQYMQMDMATSKMEGRCEMLQQLNRTLEEENKQLMTQLTKLLEQNQELLAQTLESKEQFHEEERQFSDKLNELKRQKEKLEEKIMDHYKGYEPSPPRRKGFKLFNKISAAMSRTNKAPKERDKKTSKVSLSDNVDGQGAERSDSSSIGSYGDSLDGSAENTNTQKSNNVQPDSIPMRQSRQKVRRRFTFSPGDLFESSLKSPRSPRSASPRERVTTLKRSMSQAIVDDYIDMVFKSKKTNLRKHKYRSETVLNTILRDEKEEQPQPKEKKKKRVRLMDNNQKALSKSLDDIDEECNRDSGIDYEPYPLRDRKQKYRSELVLYRTSYPWDYETDSSRPRPLQERQNHYRSEEFLHRRSMPALDVISENFCALSSEDLHINIPPEADSQSSGSAGSRPASHNTSYNSEGNRSWSNYSANLSPRIEIDRIRAGSVGSEDHIPTKDPGSLVPPVDRARTASYNSYDSRDSSPRDSTSTPRSHASTPRSQYNAVSPGSEMVSLEQFLDESNKVPSPLFTRKKMEKNRSHSQDSDTVLRDRDKDHLARNMMYSSMGQLPVDSHSARPPSSPNFNTRRQHYQSEVNLSSIPKDRGQDRIHPDSRAMSSSTSRLDGSHPPAPSTRYPPSKMLSPAPNPQSSPVQTRVLTVSNRLDRLSKTPTLTQPQTVTVKTTTIPGTDKPTIMDGKTPSPRGGDAPRRPPPEYNNYSPRGYKPPSTSTPQSVRYSERPTPNPRNLNSQYDSRPDYSRDSRPSPRDGQYNRAPPSTTSPRAPPSPRQQRANPRPPPQEQKSSVRQTAAMFEQKGRDEDRKGEAPNNQGPPPGAEGSSIWYEYGCV
ncbi:girdin-like isoform X19 [Branchiostoma lanceolatum]|uniref:girdin-like isoform X19 n=1 Tax=Branchiostoma lanceolatum TaxID=7740 RepID=UPI0034570BFB